MGGNTSILLICTVGGSPEPIVAAIKYWRPVRVRFVHTPDTRAAVESQVLPKANEEDVVLDSGRYDTFELPDGQDLAGCVNKLQQLTPDILKWVGRGDTHQVVVDFTGGTKCMSAAIALHARRWPCLFSYVGGEKRTKDGVGVVVSGAEKVVHQANPWNALGYQAVEDFIVLFDQADFVAAAGIATAAKMRVSRPDRKRELNAIEQLAKAFDAWDRFDHQGALNTFGIVEQTANDLRAVLAPQTAEHALEDVRRAKKHLEELCKAIPPSRLHVVDLLANAQRRKEEGRFDDGIARLYRAIEALGQVALKEAHGIESTEKVPLALVPESLRSGWTARAREGTVALGLQDTYALLTALHHDLGRKFQEAKLDDAKSPLAARNRSILAHGFERAPNSVFDGLCSQAISLAGIATSDLPRFPRLGTAPG
jgi:CRISPR-associated protein (TIGR02710 family)